MQIVTVVCPNSLKQNTYIVSDNNTTILIDCGASLELVQEQYKKETQKDLPNIDAILLTHTHFDHTWALKEFTTNTPVFVKQGAKNWISDPHYNASGFFGNPLTYTPQNVIEINNEQPFKIGNLEITPIFTEGHSECSICYLINNYLFTGDTEFYLSVGRTDFPSGNSVKLAHSLEKIRNINATLRYPGHGIPYKK